MRIIDADELKKCKVYSEERHEYVVAVFNIDNAPTVELTETEIQAVLNKRCMTAVTNEYLIALHNNRPTGKWEDFAKFVANEVLDDYFGYNSEAFAELACRRLVELGLVELHDGYYRMKGAEE